MKLTNYIQLGLLSFCGLGLATSCQDMLNEQPRTILTQTYFETPNGVKGGLIAVYSNLRYLFGGDSPLSTTMLGTDEFEHTDQIGSGYAAFDTYDPAQLTASNGMIGNYWNNGLQNINTCNGVIKYAEASTSMDEAEKKQVLGEAHFLRGFLYYLVTMEYGDVPLDFGSGELQYNTIPTTTSVRVKRSRIFEKIIEDLKYACENLSDKQTEKGRAFKATAYHFLAKTYLTAAGLKDCNDINADYYEKAYETATYLINNAGRFGVSLTEDYALVNKEGHENDPEVLFNVQHTWSESGPNLNYDDSGNGTNDDGYKYNEYNFFFTAGYENVKVNNGSGTVAIVPRNIEYQRPWRMVLPTRWLVVNAFNDKVNDSRFDASFRMEWNAGVDFSVKGRQVKKGETAIRISLNNSETAAPEDSVAENGVIYKPYALYYWGMLYNEDGSYKQSAVQYIYPSLTKYDDTKRLNMNYASNRPLILARFAETYLIAAEAAYYAGKNDAAKYINVIRERAAYRDGLSTGELASRKAKMDITEKDVNLDFILDERSREMCGEGWRWIDLVRTNKLKERASAYNYYVRKQGALAADKDNHFLLRPVPQTQIDLLSDPSQKNAYQNPGY